MSYKMLNLELHVMFKIFWYSERGTFVLSFSKLIFSKLTLVNITLFKSVVG